MGQATTTFRPKAKRQRRPPWLLGWRRSVDHDDCRRRGGSGKGATARRDSGGPIGSENKTDGSSPSVVHEGEVQVEVYADERPEERSRLTLEWTSRFSRAGWCSRRRRSCRTGIEVVVVGEALIEADGIGALRP
jgi:hypothetical protein